MSESVSNEQIENALFTFYYLQAEDTDSEYEEFRETYTGILYMVAHKVFGWVDNITPKGWESVVIAYNELESLGYLENTSHEEFARTTNIFRK